MVTVSKALCLLASLSLCAPGRAEMSFTGQFSLRQVLDDNIFIQDQAPLAAGQTTAALPARAHALITAAGASLRWSGKNAAGLRWDASYAPEIFRFSRYSSENHTDHRLAAHAAGHLAENEYDVKASWLSTAGSHEAPVFNRLGGSPPIGSEPVRARRAQDIFKFNGRLTHPFGHGFARGIFSLNQQDFHTRESAVLGCANYVDRGEWFAGADLGWRWSPDFALITSLRQGRQRQADLLGVPLHYTNTVTRWLVGAEGKAGQRAQFNILAGVDRHHFGPSVRAGFARRQTSSFLDATGTWSPAKTDALSLTARRTLWLPSSGRGVYFDTLYELGWKHTFSPRWQLATSLSHHRGELTPYNPGSPRDDWVRAVSAGLACTLDARTKIEGGVSQDWSRSAVVNTPAREYHRRIYSIGCSRSW